MIDKINKMQLGPAINLKELGAEHASRMSKVSDAVGAVVAKKNLEMVQKEFDDASPDPSTADGTFYIPHVFPFL